MVNIPQLYREKLASSVVGTPGVDVSGQMAGEFVARGAEETAAPIWGITEKQQAAKDEASYYNLMYQHKNNIAAAFEDAKVKYANNPEAIGPAMIKAVDDSRNAAVEAAPNPRVKLMAMKGDPFMESWTVKESYAWESTQRYNLDAKESVDFLDKGAHTAAATASNPNNSMADILNASIQYNSSLASLTQKLKAGKNPWMAEEVESKGMRSYAVSTMDGVLASTRPALAAQLLANPGFNKYLEPQDRLHFASATATLAQEWPKITMDKAVLNSLGQDPEFTSRLEKGQATIADVDALARQKYPNSISDSLEDSPKTPTGSMIKYMRAIASTTQLAARGQLRQDATVDLFHQTIDLAKKFSVDVVKLSQLDGKGGANITEDINQLFSLKTAILGAQAKNLITSEEAQTYLTHLYDPLASMVLKQHRPNIFETQHPGEAIKGVIRWLGLPDSSDKVAEFQTASKIIEGSFERNGVTKNEDKLQLYNSYFTAADKYLKPTMLNQGTGAPYTAEDVAHSVAGQGKGDYYPSRFGLRVIIGYDKKGAPIIKTTPEDDEKVSQQQIQNALYKQKAEESEK